MLGWIAVHLWNGSGCISLWELNLRILWTCDANKSAHFIYPWCYLHSWCYKVINWRWTHFILQTSIDRNYIEQRDVRSLTCWTIKITLCLFQCKITTRSGNNVSDASTSIVVHYLSTFLPVYIDLTFISVITSNILLITSNVEEEEVER